MIETILLSSKPLVVTKIVRKTKAKMFQNLKVGDRVVFSIPIKEAGHNRSTYASYIKAENIETQEASHSSFNQIPSILNAFEFDEVIDSQIILNRMKIEKPIIDCKTKIEFCGGSTLLEVLND